MLRKVLYWLPRVLLILFTVLISILAVDVFFEGYGFPEVFIALFMHLIPTFILIGLTVLAWKKELIGGLLIIGLGIFTIFFFNYNPGEYFEHILIQGPIFFIGVLFLINYWMKNENRKRKNKR